MHLPYLLHLLAVSFWIAVVFTMFREVWKTALVVFTALLLIHFVGIF